METQIQSHAFTADASTDAIQASGGDYLFSHQGSSYGGGTIKLQYSEDGGTTWTDVADTDATAAEQLAVMTGAGTLYRINLASSSSPSITASFRKTRPAERQ